MIIGPDHEKLIFVREDNRRTRGKPNSKYRENQQELQLTCKIDGQEMEPTATACD